MKGKVKQCCSETSIDDQSESEDSVLKKRKKAKRVKGGSVDKEENVTVPVAEWKAVMEFVQ